MRHRLVGSAVIMVGLLAVAMASCSNDNDLKAVLNDLEVMVESDPDAALKQLDSIAPLPSDPKERALHILLTARARHRCFIDETNDSLISIAVRYFTSHPSLTQNGVSRKMLALYHQGVIRENDGNYLMALDSFLEAEAAALPLDDNYFLGYIYRHLGLLYENIHAGKESVYYGKKSYEAFHTAQSDANEAYAMCELGYAYGVYCQFDSSRIWTLKCLQQPYTQVDRRLHAEALRNAGKASANLGETDAAIEYFDQIRTKDPDHFSREDARQLVRVYFYNGNRQMVKELCQQYLSNDSSATEGVPFEILYARGDVDAAFKAIKAEYDRELMNQQEYSRQNLTRAIAEFREQEVSNEIDHGRRNMAVWILATCLGVAVMIIALMVMSRKIKRGRKELTSLMITMESLNKDLRARLHDKDCIISENENKHAQALQSYYTLLENQIQQIDEMTSLFSEPTSTSENRRLYKRIVRLKEDFRDPRFLSKMEQEVNAFHGDIIRRLRDEFPGMKEEDVRLFLYQVCGFSGRTISFLTGEELTALYPRRSRLKARITRSEAPSRADFLSYFK